MKHIISIRIEDELVKELNKLAKKLNKSKTEILKEAFILYKNKFSKHPLKKFAGRLKESEPFLKAIEDRNIKSKDIHL